MSSAINQPLDPQPTTTLTAATRYLEHRHALGPHLAQLDHNFFDQRVTIEHRVIDRAPYKHCSCSEMVFWEFASERDPTQSYRVTFGRAGAQS